MIRELIRKPSVTTDGVAAKHTVNNIDFFEEHPKFEKMKLTVADGLNNTIPYKEKVTLKVRIQPIFLRDVYFVPSLRMSAAPCSKLDQRRVYMTFERKNVHSGTGSKTDVSKKQYRWMFMNNRF